MPAGQFDGNLTVSSSLAQPTIAGNMRFSQGTLFMLPAGGAGDAATAAGAAGSRAAGAGPAGIKGAASAAGAPAAALPARGQRWGDGPVARAFEAFTRSEPDLAEQINAMMQQEVGLGGQEAWDGVSMPKP